MSSLKLPNNVLSQIFFEARTHRHWITDKEILEKDLYKLQQMVYIGPTSCNSQPIRLIFIKSKEGKERLKPYLDQGNIERTMTAPITVIIAYDTKFYEKLSHNLKKVFLENENIIDITAFQNSSIQGGYFIIAARALGFDCGPMSGYNKEGLDKEFLYNTNWRSNFLVNVGYGDKTKLKPRKSRLSFDESCMII